MLCLALAALESSGEQTTLSRLADDVLRLRSGDDALPIDLTLYDQRRALVDAVTWLADRNVIMLRDGATDRWLRDDPDGDALYDIDRDVISRLLVNAPSVLRDVAEPADFLVDAVPASIDGQQTRLRHRLARRLVTEPVLYYADLDDDELAYARWRRTRIIADLERLTGARIESRAEGWCLVDTEVEPISADRFPGKGSVAHAALLWAGELVEVSRDSDRPGVVDESEVAESGRLISAEECDRTWRRVVETYGTRFKADYREHPDRLKADVTDLLRSLSLIRTTRDGSLLIMPTLARYRPAVRLAEDAQLSLLATLDDEGARA
jgi:uncharacterized protein (TIGR02678 family)